MKLQIGSQAGMGDAGYP